MTYPGGKAASGTYQQIINLIPPHRVYIETHLGGGAIARAKRPAAVNILIDLDAAAIAAFGDRISRDGGIASGGDMVTTPLSAMGDHIAVFDDTIIIDDGCRQVSPFPAIPDPIAGRGDAPAAPFPAILASPIANDDEGLHRHLWRGGPTPPDSAIVASPATNSDTRCTFHLLNADALAFLRSYPFQGDEFVYCDPPYLMATRRQHRPIYRCELSEADHVALLACLLSLPCKVMLSGYYSDLYADALKGWHTHTFEAVTRGGSMATEWLWMNYARPVALHQYDYLGAGFRERERIKRKKTRWVERLRRMPALEKQAILAAIEEAGVG